MRTTLTLDDDVFAEATRRADLLKVSVGKAVSDLVRRGLAATPPLKEVNGLLVFDTPKDAPLVTLGQVREALDQE